MVTPKALLAFSGLKLKVATIMLQQIDGEHRFAHFEGDTAQPATDWRPVWRHVPAPRQIETV